MPDIHNYIAVLTASLISVMGCLFIISLYLRFKDLQQPAYKLIAYLALIDFFHCLAFIIPTYNLSDSSFLCIFQAQLITAITLAGVVWTSVICLFLYFVIKKKKHYDSYITSAFLFVSALCIILSFLPLSTCSYSDYSKNNGWCWLKNKYFQLALFYIPLWIIILANSMIYFTLIRHIKYEFKFDSEVERSGRTLIRKFIVYPVVMVISYTPVTIYRIFQVSGNDHRTNEEMAMVAGIFTCLNGIFNAVAYGFTATVRKILFDSKVNEMTEPIAIKP